MIDSEESQIFSRFLQALKLASLWTYEGESKKGRGINEHNNDTLVWHSPPSIVCVTKLTLERRTTFKDVVQ
jgi:hypothetical protein